MVKSIKKQGNKFSINNEEGFDFYEYKRSNNCTQWKIAFEQSQYLEQIKNKLPRGQLLDFNIEISSYNKEISK